MVSTKNPIINAHVSCPPHACHLAKLIIFAQKNRKCSIDSAKVTVCSVRFRSYKDSCHLPVAMQAICAWLRNDLRVHDNAVLHEAKLVVDWKVCQLWKPSRVGITIQNELDLPKSVSFVCHVNTYAGNSWLVYSYLYVQMCFWPIKWNPSNQGRSSSYNQYSVRLQQQRSIFLKAARLSAQRKVPVLPVYVWKPRRAEAPMFFLLKPQMDQRIQLGGFIDFWMVSIDRWLVNFYISISWFAVMVSLIFLWGMLVTYTLNCCWILFSFWIWRFFVMYIFMWVLSFCNFLSIVVKQNWLSPCSLDVLTVLQVFDPRYFKRTKYKTLRTGTTWCRFWFIMIYPFNRCM